MERTNKQLTRTKGNGSEQVSEAVERALVSGDLSGLTPEQRIELYRRTCESLGLNPLTKPFDYIRLNNKLTLYAKRDCTDQLRMLRNVSVDDVTSKLVADVFIVTTHVSIPDPNRPDGLRRDRATGAVYIGGLSAEALANAMMKSETKSKRRATLSICGLGILDESEVDSVQGAERVVFAREEPRREPKVERQAVRKPAPKTPLKAVAAPVALEFEEDDTSYLEHDLGYVVFHHLDPKAERLEGRTLGDIYDEDRMTLHNIMKSPQKRAGLHPELRQTIGDFLAERELERHREEAERRAAANWQQGGKDDGPAGDMVFELEK